jgi:hypothetical protein
VDVTETRTFVGFRLAAGSLAKVDDLAKQRGTDRSEALRYLLGRGWQAHEATPEGSPRVKRPADDPESFTERHRRLQKPGKR